MWRNNVNGSKHLDPLVDSAFVRGVSQRILSIEPAPHSIQRRGELVNFSIAYLSSTLSDINAGHSYFFSMLGSFLFRPIKVEIWI